MLNSPQIYVSLMLIFIATALAVKLLIFIAPKVGLVDIPNTRSAHSISKPRGGGLVFMVFFELIVLCFWRDLPSNLCLTLLFGSLAIATISLLDDLRNLSAIFRLLIQLATAVLSLVLLGLFPHSPSFMGFAAFAMQAAFIIWMINLYNFMDGIDGLAILEAVFIVSMLALLSVSPKIGLPPALWMMFLASLLGFLVWNFPKARVFMGDVGSASLGYLFGVLSVYTISIHGQAMASCWLILLSGFLADSTLTLIARMLKGENVLKAHSSHIYQRLARKLGNHFAVVLIYMAINIFIAFPCAIFVLESGRSSIYPIGLAYLPYIILFVWMSHSERKKSFLKSAC